MFDPDKMTYEERGDKVLYLCDGKDETCSSCGEEGFCLNMCKHTWNIDHAKNLTPKDNYPGYYQPTKLLKFEPMVNELTDQYDRPVTWVGVWEVEDE